MISCKQAAELASQSQDRPLKLTERLALRFHTIGCKACLQYTQQLRVLRSVCERIDDDGALASPQLADDARERIRQRLKQG